MNNGYLTVQKCWKFYLKDSINIMEMQSENISSSIYVSLFIYKFMYTTQITILNMSLY